MTTSLEKLCSTEEQREIARKLAESGIFTDGELLLADDTALKRSTLSHFELDEFSKDVSYSSIHPIQADKLLASALNPERLPTGFEQLDQILSGGLLKSSITEFAGPSNTGKTVLLSNIILSQLVSSPETEAVYIDTLGTYNPSLLQSLLPRYEADEKVLERIHLMTAFDIISLIETCEKIKWSLAEDKTPISILVIDTIANPIALLMNKGQLQGHALMQSFTHLLRLMTQEYNLITLLVNTAVKNEAMGLSAFMDTRVKPALGVTWSFCADTCVLMHRSLGEENIIVEVIRSRNGESGWTWIEPKSFTFASGEGM